MNLHVLIDGLGVRAVHGTPAGIRICDLTEDSRTVVPGSLFIARKGEKADGRRFVPQAVAAGAAAILTDDASGLAADCLLETPDIARTTAMLGERFFRHPARALQILGITGTNGKTTTAFLAHHLLNRAGVRCGMIGTVIVDDGREVAEASLTTPPSLELSRTLATMAESGCRACAMEVSSHSLAQGRVEALTFAAAIFTNLSGDHLDYHGTMGAYADAKALLFERLAPSAVAIVNADDPAAARMVRDCRAKVWRCSLGAFAGAECRADILALDLASTRLALAGPWGRFEAVVPLVGRHNAMNILQACAGAHSLGLGAPELRAGLASAAAPPGRLEPVRAPEPGPTVLVDYAHTDDALEKALLATRALVDRDAGRRLWVVFGCGGDRDRTKRPRMGATAARLADRVIITSDNPRTEAPRAIIAEILAGVGPAPHAHAMEDREAAIGLAIAGAEPGDVVLIAGKGHENYQIVADGRGGTLKRHFDDREVARAALAARGAAVP